jgi:hypothetical protein
MTTRVDRHCEGASPKQSMYLFILNLLVFFFSYATTAPVILQIQQDGVIQSFIFSHLIALR